MKNKIILKEFSALSFAKGVVATAATLAGSSSPPQRAARSVRRFIVRQARRAEQFRESLHRRYATPFVSANSYRHWGINE